MPRSTDSRNGSASVSRCAASSAVVTRARKRICIHVESLSSVAMIMPVRIDRLIKIRSVGKAVLVVRVVEVPGRSRLAHHVDVLAPAAIRQLIAQNIFRAPSALRRLSTTPQDAPRAAQTFPAHPSRVSDWYSPPLFVHQPASACRFAFASRSDPDSRATPSIFLWQRRRSARASPAWRSRWCRSRWQNCSKKSPG